jgi:hypothetical protein
MNLSCPCCYAEFPLEAAIESDAGRDYARLLLSQPPAIQRGLSAYVWLFRSAKRNLSYERRLKLANEVLGMGADPRQLAAALSDTVEALRAKRDAGDVRPLTGHNYLKRVLESVMVVGPAALVGSGSVNETRPATGKRRQAIEVLAEWAGNDWLRREIAEGLMALVALSRPGTPGADTIELTAGVWETAMRSAGVTVEQIDHGRVRAGFQPLLKRRLDEWPEPYAVIAELPRRPAQRKLEEPPPTAEERAQSAELLRQAQKTLGGRR